MCGFIWNSMRCGGFCRRVLLFKFKDLNSNQMGNAAVEKSKAKYCILKSTSLVKCDANARKRPM